MPENKSYAGFWVRFFAGSLDAVFLLLPMGALFFFCCMDSYQSFNFHSDFSNYSSVKASASSSHGYVVDLIFYGINIAYITYFLTGKKQATIGKRLLGIYVGNPDGSKLSNQKAICRALASILTAMTLGLGFLIVIFTKEKTALHDLLCNTRVFHGKK